jgi:hypothetical protein
MNLRWSAARLDTFDDCWEAFPELREASRDDAAREWRRLLAHSGDLTMAVFDHDRRLSDRTVGLAQMVFVTDDFVDRAVAGLCPSVVADACRLMPSGASPLLDAAAIRAANSGPGLNALTTRWLWRADAGSDAELRRLRGRMDRAYGLFRGGYRYRRILLPVGGETAYSTALRQGYRLAADYGDYYRAHPPLPPAQLRPYLMHADSETAAAAEGTAASRLFDYAPPRFRFSAPEQETLWSALMDLSNREIERESCIGPDALKKRWESIYRRVFELDPCLLPGILGQTRGREKRAWLLHYLRDHLEEIRPFAARSFDDREPGVGASPLQCRTEGRRMTDRPADANAR